MLIAGAERSVRPDEIIGRASVIDGDTLEIRGERIRLHGVDAPEASQTCQRSDSSYRCGRDAALYLSDLIGTGTVHCRKRDIDRYGRTVATCQSAGRDLGELLVSAGWALAYTQYSLDYLAAERKAKQAGRGIWAGSFVQPAEYRAERRGGGN
ncbi:thermonuclease family protein [Phenylobacterium sp.]|uniref:thermonuclease family protein n=1 Tax=Phenylobacterium sp. TaxID=1871053 RepID=UPI0039C8CACA